MDELTELARAIGSRGEIVLRRRGRGDHAVDELIVNGAFAMDSAETSTERALATLPFPYAGAEVLLGGLGLGYTADALLETDVRAVDIVEFEPALVGWARAGVTTVLSRVARDPRVRLLVADIATVLKDAGRSWDAILLDVDNGPDFLIHPENADLYSAVGIETAAARLRPGGMLAIWCQGAAVGLPDTMAAYGQQHTHSYRVNRGTRSWSYVIYTLRRHDRGTPE